MHFYNTPHSAYRRTDRTDEINSLIETTRKAFKLTTQNPHNTLLHIFHAASQLKRNYSRYWSN